MSNNICLCRRRFAGLCFAGLVMALADGDPARGQWPQFRGPAGQGHAAAAGLPDHWSETEHVAWKTAIPGRGWSSPVVDENQVWMTTAVVTKASQQEAERRLAEIPNSRGLEIAARVVLRAVCVDWQTGRLLHDVELLSVDKPQPIHSLNSFASPTPVLEDGRLYCHFGSYGTACLDTKTLQRRWLNQQLRVDHQNGPGASPVLWHDYLIVHCDGRDQQFVAALDKHTGQLAWKTRRSGKLSDREDFRKAYCTPLLIEDPQGTPQLISPGADWVYSYDPRSGRELWRASYGKLGFSNVARPVYHDGVAYICTCFMSSTVMAVRCDGAGDVTDTHVLWKYDKQAPRMPSPILVDGALFMVSDSGIATCLDAASGEPLWKERLGGNFSASPIFADGKLYFLNREGQAFVMPASREFRQPKISELDGRFMASAAALDGALLLRTDTHLYRIQNQNTR